MPYVGPRPKPGVMSSGDRVGDEVIVDGQVTHSRSKREYPEETNIELFSSREEQAREAETAEVVSVDDLKPPHTEVVLQSGEVLDLMPAPEGAVGCDETLTFYDPAHGVYVDIPKDKCEVRDCG